MINNSDEGAPKNNLSVPLRQVVKSTEDWMEYEGVLLLGQIQVEVTQLNEIFIKIGDQKNRFVDLPYVSIPGFSNGVLSVRSLGGELLGSIIK